MDGDSDLKSLSLGAIEAPKSFADDLRILKLYQSFSAEILRLALLGIAAIATIVLTILKGENVAENINWESRAFLILSGLRFWSLCSGSVGP